MRPGDASHDMWNPKKANEAITKSVHSSALLPIVLQVPGMYLHHLSVSESRTCLLGHTYSHFSFLRYCTTSIGLWSSRSDIDFAPPSLLIVFRLSFLPPVVASGGPCGQREAKGLDVAHDHLMARCFSLLSYLGNATIHCRPDKPPRTN